MALIQCQISNPDLICPDTGRLEPNHVRSLELTSRYNSGSDVFQASGGLATVGESQNGRVLESSNCVTRVGRWFEIQGCRSTKKTGVGVFLSCCVMLRPDL